MTEVLLSHPIQCPIFSLIDVHDDLMMLSGIFPDAFHAPLEVRQVVPARYYNREGGCLGGGDWMKVDPGYFQGKGIGVKIGSKVPSRKGAKTQSLP
jgi:hypothetical protein